MHSDLGMYVYVYWHEYRLQKRNTIVPQDCTSTNKEVTRMISHQIIRLPH